MVNREFLDWLSRRRQPERPFFAFLNYYDAHYPYQLPRGGIHRFGAKPRNQRESTVMQDWLLLAQKAAFPAAGRVRPRLLRRLRRGPRRAARPADRRARIAVPSSSRPG